MRSGRTLWEDLALTYDQGVSYVAEMRATWAGLAPYVDARRHADVAAFLAIQQDEATWWRDASLAYFQSRSGLPLPNGVAPPAHSLDWYQAQDFPYAPGHWPNR